MVIASLRPLLEQFVQRGPAGCACVVTRDGKEIESQYVGYANREERIPIAPDTIYRIFSMTKVITCIGALRLYEKGAYLLNDRLSDYLPEFKSPKVYVPETNGTFVKVPASKPILVKDLFTMTSGLTYGGNDSETARETARVVRRIVTRDQKGEHPTVRDLSKALARVPLAFEPGTHWKYGLSHDVLGAFIEVLTGKSFGVYLRDEIFEPLGMRDTSFRIPPQKRNRLAAAYARAANGALTPSDEWDVHIGEGCTYESGGGGLLSTITDYSRFAQMLAAGGELNGVRIIGRKTIDLMTTNHLRAEQRPDFNWQQMAGYGYGLGVRVLVDKAGGGANGTIGEFGWGGLLGTWLLADSAERLTVVYMQQMLPSLEPEFHPRLRAAIYASL